MSQIFISNIVYSGGDGGGCPAGVGGGGAWRSVSETMMPRHAGSMVPCLQYRRFWTIVMDEADRGARALRVLMTYAITTKIWVRRLRKKHEYDTCECSVRDNRGRKVLTVLALDRWKSEDKKWWHIWELNWTANRVRKSFPKWKSFWKRFSFPKFSFWPPDYTHQEIVSVKFRFENDNRFRNDTRFRNDFAFR